MSKRSIDDESSSTAQKRQARATVDDEGPPRASLGHSPSSSVPKIQMSLDIHLIAGLILPFVPDRVTWNNVCGASKELYRAGKNLTPPWPNTTIKVYSTTHHDVRAVAFSPSGSHLAFGTSQGSVHVWNRWGKETILQGDTGNITTCLEYSSDGTYLASGSAQRGLIRLWPTKSFHTTSTKPSSEKSTAMPLAQQTDSSILLGNQMFVAVLAFSRTDSNLLASGGRPGQIKLWNVIEQACIYSYQGLHNHVTPTLHFFGGNRIVCNAVLPTGSMIRLWREEGSSVFTSEVVVIPGAGRLGDTEEFVCPAFSPCGSFLTIAYSSPLREGSGTRIEFYELETMLTSQSVLLPGFASVCSAFSPDSKQLVIHDVKGQIRLLQTDNFNIQKYLNTGRGGRCVAFDPTCRVLAIGSYNEGTVQLRSIPSETGEFYTGLA
jgi:WD40 repeat protein